MPIKRCSVKTCKSCTTRIEDKGVTYHKYPKDDEIRGKWKTATHTTIMKSMPLSFVCSRHFCKGDFVKNKENKYNLKSGIQTKDIACLMLYLSISVVYS